MGEEMAFVYARTIRFHETDAAGVVYFANLLTLCHEAYEAALGSLGIDLKSFFSAVGGVAVPIVHAEADYHQPLFCGDAIAITLKPQQLSPHSFEIAYQITAPLGPAGTHDPLAKPLAKALTRHVCIRTDVSRRHPLPLELTDWIAALAAPNG